MEIVSFENGTKLGPEGFFSIDFNTSLKVNATDDNIVPEEGARAGFIVTTILSAWITLANILFIIVLLANKHLRRRSSMFLLNMSVSRLCVGAFIMPFMAMLELKNGSWIFGDLLCQIWLAADVAFSAHSVYALLIVNVDRLVFLTQPVNYRRRLNNTRVISLILCTWVPAVGIVVPMFLDLDDMVSAIPLDRGICAQTSSPWYVFVSGLVQYYVPAAFILVANLVLCIAAARMRPSVQLRSAGKGGHPGFRQDGRPDAKNIVLVMSVVNAAHLLMWLPYFLVTLIDFLKPEFPIPFLMYSFSLYVGYANSGLTPILWAIDKDVRAGYWRVLWCKCCGRRYKDGYTFNGSSNLIDKENVEMTGI